MAAAISDVVSFCSEATLALTSDMQRVTQQMHFLHSEPQ